MDSLNVVRGTNLANFTELIGGFSKLMRTVKNLVYTLDFSEIGLKDVGQVGGKNASPGELFNSLKPKGVGDIDGAGPLPKA